MRKIPRNLLPLLAFGLAVSLGGSTTGCGRASTTEVSPASGAALEPNTPPEPGTAAAARSFCMSEAFKTLKCGWASHEEESATESGAFAGTIWTGEPTVPGPLGESRSYNQYAGHIVSLACKGLVTVRAVYQNNSSECSRLENVTLGNVARDSSPVSVCEMNNGREENCKQYSSWLDCPAQQVGKWYSARFTAMFDGCSALTGADDRYSPMMPAMLLNPGSNIYLSEFEVIEAGH